MKKTNYFLYSFLGLIIFQVIMSMEEIIGNFPGYLVILTGKAHKVISFIPVLHLNDQSFILVSLLLMMVFIIIGVAIFLGSGWSKILAIILGVIEVFNGGLHIVASLYFMRYIPGSVSAVGVIIFGLLIILIRPSSQSDEPEQV
jgi:hypothetical protein